MAALFSRSNPLFAFALLTAQKIAKGPAWQVALALLIWCFGLERMVAGGSGLNTVVILNQASQNSREIANRYCERRDVPPDHVLRIFWSGDPNQWTSAEFETHLRTQLLSLVASLLLKCLSGYCRGLSRLYILTELS